MKNLVDRGLSEHQGPALLVHNDAVFTDEDFDSLISLGGSVKINQRTATGKFGLGFNSMLHHSWVGLMIGLWMD